MKKFLFILALLVSCFVNVAIGQETFNFKSETDFFGDTNVSVVSTRVVLSDSTITVYEKGKKPNVYFRCDTKPLHDGSKAECVELATGVYGYETVYPCFKDLLIDDEYYFISFRVITTQYSCHPKSKYCIIWHQIGHEVQGTVAYWRDLE